MTDPKNEAFEKWLDRMLREHPSEALSWRDYYDSARADLEEKVKKLEEGLAAEKSGADELADEVERLFDENAHLRSDLEKAVELLTKTEPWVRFYSDDIMRGFQDRQTAKERTEEIRAFLQSQKGESRE